MAVLHQSRVLGACQCDAKPIPIVKLASLPCSRAVPPAKVLGRTPHASPAAPCALAAARGTGVIAAGASKQSLYTQLPQRGESPTPGFDTIASALEDLAAGKFVVVLDDEDRENEGDLIINADKVTPEAMAFMVEQTSGVICISMEGRDLDRLKLPLMVTSAENDESMYTAFTITLDLRHGTTTGISAADRAATLRAMADPATSPDDFRRPGHIFPLRYRQGGVIVRPGHTEAAVDLARASGSYPAGVLCEIVDRSDGSMARTPQLMQFAAQHGLKIITIADLIRHRLRHEQLLQHVAAVPLDTRSGPFTAHCFRSLVDGAEHVALVAGDVAASPSSSSPSSSSSGSTQQHQQGGVLARVQMQQRLTDVFGSLHCGRGPFLDQAMQEIAAAGRGVVLYVQGNATKGRGLAAELEVFAASQEDCSISGRAPGAAAGDAAAAAAAGPLDGANRGGASSSLTNDLRDSAVAAHMLRQLGVQRVALLTDDPTEAQRLSCCGVEAAVVGWPDAGFDSSRMQLQAMLEASSSSGSNGSSSNGAAVKPAGSAH